MFVRCSDSNLWHSRGGTPKHTQTVIDATQKATAIDQQHSYETLTCQHHQTILRLLSSAATASTRWRVLELNCLPTYSLSPNHVWIDIERFGIDFRNGKLMYLFFEAPRLDVESTEHPIHENRDCLSEVRRPWLKANYIHLVLQGDTKKGNFWKTQQKLKKSNNNKKWLTEVEPLQLAF